MKTALTLWGALALLASAEARAGIVSRPAKIYPITLSSAYQVTRHSGRVAVSFTGSYKTGLGRTHKVHCKIQGFGRYYGKVASENCADRHYGCDFSDLRLKGASLVADAYADMPEGQGSEHRKFAEYSIGRVNADGVLQWNPELVAKPIQVHPRPSIVEKLIGESDTPYCLITLEPARP